MARLNIEDSIWTDPRFEALRGTFDKPTAIGWCLLLWRLGQEYYKKDRTLIPEDIYRLGGFPKQMIEYGFCEVRESGIYVRGSEEQFEWIAQKVDAGRKGGLKSSKSRKNKDLGEAMLKRHSSGAQAHLGKTQAKTNPLTLTPSPTPPLTPTLRKRTNINIHGGGPKDPTPVTIVRDSFLKSYEKEFGRSYPGWGAKENTQAKNWLRSVSIEKAIELCDLYPKWNDSWVTKQGHPFGLLTTSFVQLEAWAKSSGQLIQKMAAGKAAEKVALAEAMGVEEMKAYGKLSDERNSRRVEEISQSTKQRISVSGEQPSLHALPSFHDPSDPFKGGF